MQPPFAGFMLTSVMRICLLRCVLGAVGMSIPVCVLAADQLEVFPLVLDFGLVPRNASELEGVIHLKNIGLTNVEISDVISGCGCSSAQVDSKSLKSGEETRLRTKSDFSRKLGLQEISVVLLYGDPQQNVVVRVRAIVTDAVTVVPPVAVMKSDVSEDETVELTVRVKPPYDTWDLSEVKCDPKCISAVIFKKEVTDQLATYSLLVDRKNGQTWGGEKVTNIELKFVRPESDKSKVEAFSTFIRVERHEKQRSSIVPSVLTVDENTIPNTIKFTVLKAQAERSNPIIHLPNSDVDLELQYKEIDSKTCQIEFHLSRKTLGYLLKEKEMKIQIGEETLYLPLHFKK